MAAPLGPEVDAEVVRRLKDGQTIRGIARDLGVSRGVVALRRRRLDGREVPSNGTRSKYTAKRFSDPPDLLEMCCAALWEKVIEYAIRDGDMKWFTVMADHRDQVGTFTWCCIQLGVDPEDALEAILYREARDPLFPRRGDGSVILWDWGTFDTREMRIEERDAASGGGGDVTGQEAPGVGRARVRSGDGRPRWDEGRRQDPCSVGA